MGFIDSTRASPAPKASRRKASTVRPTGAERTFDASEIIVSKTDLTGRITYANREFMRIAGYSEQELLGAPHSLIRHPDMPRAVFKLLWDTLAARQEVFAYVKNMARNGDHYWVFAHVTPSVAADGTVIGYHSSRRVADRQVVEQVIAPLYRNLLAEENRHQNRKDGLGASWQMLADLLKDRGIGYDEFVFSL